MSGRTFCQRILSCSIGGSAIVKTRLTALLTLTLLVNRASHADPAIVLGSKNFTGSSVLSELAKRSLQQAGFQVEHRQGIGGAIVLWDALRQGSVAAYPDYSSAADWYFKQIGRVGNFSHPESFEHRLGHRTVRHLILVGLSLAASII